MNVNLGIWGKLTRVVIFLLLIAGLLGVAVWYLPLIRQNERYRKRNLQLEAQRQKLEETSKQLKVPSTPCVTIRKQWNGSRANGSVTPNPEKPSSTSKKPLPTRSCHAERQTAGLH